MLKIKDNLDLKELEKYGFVKLDNDLRKHKYSWKRLLGDGCYYELYVNRENHLNIYLQLNNYEYVRIAGKLQSQIYDLIKDGLVIKVDD